ncbi:hypothetical protein QAD02_006031 [Eretmocerus hayati]|uniref:Uncharacterized protein n=1 Tax=Eretmocerus hayati TaxID=131215 RepID=A0ACC2N246_9HYME|nr:hypothetical protein QAD02_006031 [Eretmocerus hayati]
MAKVENNDLIDINDLNDDCLENILEFIPLTDRFSAELVCKRWYCICSLLWKKCRKFDIDDFYRTDENGQGYNTKLLKRVFARCAQYITELNISQCYEKDTIFLAYEPYRKRECTKENEEDWRDLKEISLRCTNLEILTLGSTMIEVDDTYLSLLLSRNENIRTLYLTSYVDLEGQSEFRIPYKNLETLVLSYCSIPIDSLDLRTLNESTKLKNLMFAVSSKSYVDLAFHHFQPKNLEQLHLDEHIFDVPNIIDGLVDPSRLKVLRIENRMISESKAITNTVIRQCQNLEALGLDYRFYDHDLCRINDSLKKLVCLDISFCDASTDLGVSNVNTNLKCLNADSTEITDEGVKNILRRAENLKKLNLSGCYNISEDVINIAIDAMKLRIKRNNPTPLEVGLRDTYIDFDSTLNPCPLLKFTHDDMHIMYSNYISL